MANCLLDASTWISPSRDSPQKILLKKTPNPKLLTDITFSKHSTSNCPTQKFGILAVFLTRTLANSISSQSDRSEV